MVRVAPKRSGTSDLGSSAGLPRRILAPHASRSNAIAPVLHLMTPKDPAPAAGNSPMTITNPTERISIMGEVIAEITSAGYIYDLGAGASQWAQVPPPRGTKLNCQAAARLAKQMGEARGLDKLVVVATSIKDGFLVVVAAGIKAFGGCMPPINKPPIFGWEFDNHYRVHDPVVGKTYDPVFGTSGAFNPTGILCTSTAVEFPKMISVYGKKYKVSRSTTFEVEVLNNNPVPASDVVNDSHFKPSA